MRSCWEVSISAAIMRSCFLAASVVQNGMGLRPSLSGRAIEALSEASLGGAAFLTGEAGVGAGSTAKIPVPDEPSLARALVMLLLPSCFYHHITRLDGYRGRQFPARRPLPARIHGRCARR